MVGGDMPHTYTHNYTHTHTHTHTQNEEELMFERLDGMRTGDREGKT